MTTIRPIKVAGVVVSAGKMMKTVKVRLVKQEWHRHLRKVRMIFCCTSALTLLFSYHI